MVGCILWWFCFSLFYLAAIYKIPVVSASFLLLFIGRILKLFFLYNPILVAIVLYLLVLIYFVFLDSSLFDRLKNKIIYYKEQEVIIEDHMNKGCFLFTVLKMQALVLLACFIGFYIFVDSTYIFSLLGYVDKDKKPLVFFFMFLSIVSFLFVIFLELLVISTFNTPITTLVGQFWRVGVFVGGGYLGGLATDHYIMLEGTYHPVLQPVFDSYRKLRIGYTYLYPNEFELAKRYTTLTGYKPPPYPLRENT
jgi:hypothetical protein